MTDKKIKHQHNIIVQKKKYNCGFQLAQLVKSLMVVKEI